MAGPVRLGALMYLSLCLVFSKASWADRASLDWSTFLGGSSGDCIQGIAVDDSGCAYVIGWTQSTDFPVTAGALDTIPGGSADVLVAKIDPAGNTICYATLLGGSGYEWGYGIAIDPLGNIYLSGTTTSSDFPVTPEALDTSYNGGCDDAFVARLNSSGSALDYATYLGGSYGDYGRTVAIDSSGNACLIGWTMSPNFPVTAGALDTTYNGGDYDVFVTKLNPPGSALIFSSFLGGNDRDVGYGIALDDSSNAYLTGATCSANFPATAGALDTAHHGGIEDVFVVKLKSLGTHLCYATFLGGGGADIGQAIAVDSAGNTYIAGRTSSSDFPTSISAFDTSFNGGGSDAFVVKLAAAGNTLAFATFLGGAAIEDACAIALSKSSHVFLAGHTESADFPTTAGALDTLLDGTSDIYIADIGDGGSVLHYSTFFGGSSREEAAGIAVNKARRVHVSGNTRSIDFPTTALAFDTSYNGNGDTFLARLWLGDDDPAPPERISNLTIALCKQHLALEWPAVTVDTNGNSIPLDMYYVYRDTLIFFSHESNPFDSTVENSYLDSSVAVSDSGAGYFYAVTAVSNGLESDRSELVGNRQRQLIMIEKSP